MNSIKAHKWYYQLVYRHIDHKMQNYTYKERNILTVSFSLIHDKTDLTEIGLKLDGPVTGEVLGTGNDSLASSSCNTRAT